MKTQGRTSMKKALPAQLTKTQKVKILKRARELMKTTGGWVQGAYRRPKKTTKHVSPEDYDTLGAEEFAYCIHGACNQAARELGYDVQPEAQSVLPLTSVEEVAMRKYGASAMSVNDYESDDKRKVIGLIDTRLKELEG